MDDELAAPYCSPAAASVNFRRLTDTNVYTEPFRFKYGKLATKYPRIYTDIVYSVAGRHILERHYSWSQTSEHGDIFDLLHL